MELTFISHHWKLPQSWTKVLRHLTETIAFKVTIIFCVWMKIPFSSVILPPFPQPVLQTPRGCLFVSNIEKGGRGGYLSWGERGEFTPREKRLVIVVCLNDFFPWLLLPKILYSRELLLWWQLLLTMVSDDWKRREEGDYCKIKHVRDCWCFFK